MISRYARPDMQSLWSDSHRYDTWWRVEWAACHAMEAHGVVPPGTAAALASQEGTLRPWDLNRLAQIESETQHDVVAFLQYVAERVGPGARYLHLGLTSSDVLDTSTALLLQEAGALIIRGLRDRLLPALANKAAQYKRQPIMGRSHGVHAEPITLGGLFAGFYAEGMRCLRRIEQAQHAIAVGKLSGAVGVYGASTLSPAVEAHALQQLGLRPETVSTQVVPRDRHAEWVLAMALLGCAIERWATTIRHWQRTEVGEAAEPFGSRQTGSSAMPHKKNPVLSENLCGLARLLRAEAMACLDNVALWHERDISHSSVERVVLPDVSTLADFLVHRTAGLVSAMTIDTDRMEHNMGLTRGLYFSEHVLLALIQKGLTRQEAYGLVQGHALRAHGDTAVSFRGLLETDTALCALLTPAEIAACFELDHHLRHAAAIVDRALQEGAMP